MNPGAGQPIVRPSLVENMVNAFLVQFGQHQMSAQEGASVAISVFLNVVDEAGQRNLPVTRKLVQEMITRLQPLANAATIEELRRHTRKPEQPAGNAGIIVPPRGFRG